MTSRLPALLVLPLLCAAIQEAAAAPAARPQWTRVASASGSDTYLDRRSIAREGDALRAATLVSFRLTQTTPDGTRYRSMAARHLYACEARSVTLLSQTYYPEPMGKGPVGQSFRYEKFAPEDVASGSALEAALRIVCARAGKN